MGWIQHEGCLVRTEGKDTLFSSSSTTTLPMSPSRKSIFFIYLKITLDVTALRDWTTPFSSKWNLSKYRILSQSIATKIALFIDNASVSMPWFPKIQLKLRWLPARIVLLHAYEWIVITVDEIHRSEKKGHEQKTWFITITWLSHFENYLIRWSTKK